MGGENKLIIKIAEEALELMEDIALTAENNIHQKNIHHQSSTSSLTTVHTLNDNSPVKNLDTIKNENLASLYKLKEEPFIARITVLNEEEEKEIFYISRVMPLSSCHSEITFLSYNAPMGRIASIPVGEEDEITIGNEKKFFEVLERVTYRPIQIFDEWDSSYTIIQNENMAKPITVDSLRAFLSKKLDNEEIEDILSNLFIKEDTEKKIHEGIKKEVIRNMSLRDQPILDKFQDEIFRLSLNDNLLILGSPGTGKTTTLIKRLGQKINTFHLDSNELELVNNFPTKLSHKDSWLMFTPTELLKHYVKEAFNKEGIPAPENNIKTWSNYRLYLTKQVLDILESATGKSSFIWNDEKAILKKKAFIDTIKLYEKFTLFFNQQLIEELRKSNTWLLKNTKEDNELIEIHQYIKEILFKDDFITINNLRSIDRLGKQFSEIIKKYQNDISKIIIGSLNIILNKDKEFLNKLNNFTQTINITDEEEIEEEETFDKLSTSKLTKEYNSAIRSYARAKVNGTKLNPKSKNAQIIQWLGENLIDEDKITDLGIKILTLTHLRKFLNPMKLYVSKIPLQYKKFRAKKENVEWYNIDKKSSNILHSLEIDMLLLLTLKNLNSIRATLSEDELRDNNYLSTFEPLFSEYRNQILVDEATDFSPIQLACMLELSNQKIRSFFACGDFNQRITTFGTQTEEEMKWVSSRFNIREIENPYRQSKTLTNLAKLIVNKKVNEIVDTNNEIAPILIENIADIDKLALWLKEGINEIERMVEFLPSIAIFVNTKEEVDSLATALNKVMINTPVQGYRDGQSIGNSEEIKIFDIQHIKGLEFEAVFFINVDKLAESRPDIFDKYLYVGVTRATTYLGITCEKNLPKQIEHTRNMFIDKWKD